MNRISNGWQKSLGIGVLIASFLIQTTGCATPASNQETVRTALATLSAAERDQLLTEFSKETSTEEAPAPQVITDEAAERRQPPSGKAQITIYAQGENAFLAKLEMAPNGAVPVHRDETEEYIYILEGSGTITINSKSYAVAPHTAIFMPAGAEVTYQNGDKTLVAIQVFAGPGPASKYDAWTPTTPPPTQKPESISNTAGFNAICSESTETTPCPDENQ
jgi:quercetin dioxygenase-like cupin family protein